jgi:hypothetical protein
MVLSPARILTFSPGTLLRVPPSNLGQMMGYSEGFITFFSKVPEKMKCGISKLHGSSVTQALSIQNSEAYSHYELLTR